MQAYKSFFSEDGTFVPWFHGEISRNQATDLLKSNGLEFGSYLIRADKKKPDKFTASFRGTNKDIKHILINNLGEVMCHISFFFSMTV